MLAVTHETTLTGAPMNLLHLLTWIRKHTSIEVHLVALQDGPLRHRFEEVCEVTVLDRAFGAGLLGVAQQGLIHLGSSRAWKPVASARLRPQLRQFSGYDLIYSNSIASSGILPYLPHTGVVVSHVHELQVALRTWRPPEYLEALDRSDAWIAASEAVRNLLVTERGYPRIA
ncbi:MAG: glycosyltransferase family 4 protein [Microthrixaceae bacterium]|nr:glycosyltransferase family 4 protein [Microthrixaceae bacterium]